MKFSCVLTAYKGTNLDEFKECFESIKKQTVLPNELIVVLDGPVEPTLNTFLKDIFMPAVSIVIVPLLKNVGPAPARNEGIKQSNYDIVAIMDSDDICVPNRFELQLNEFEKDDSLCLVGGHIEEFEFHFSQSLRLRRVPLSKNNIIKTLKYKSPFNNVTVMLRKDVFLKLGGYPNKKTSEDYHLWVKYFYGGFNFINLDETLVYVRFNRDAIKRRQGWKVLKDDIKTQAFLYNGGAIGFLKFFRNLLVYTFFRFSPAKIKGFIYESVLRK